MSFESFGKQMSELPKVSEHFKEINQTDVDFDASMEIKGNWRDVSSGMPDYDPDKRVESLRGFAFGIHSSSETAETENPHKEVIDGKTHYYDDNGNLYRIGNELRPNCEYELNGYTYLTDEMGRIISVEGDLHLKDHEGRLPIKDSIEDIGKGDQKEGDDRGHLIGDQFDGSNGLENMIPQDADINRNDFKNFENELAQEVKDGKSVHVKVEPVYEGDSRRPSAIVVTYSINGEVGVKVFPNGKES